MQAQEEDDSAVPDNASLTQARDATVQEAAVAESLNDSVEAEEHSTDLDDGGNVGEASELAAQRRKVLQLVQHQTKRHSKSQVNDTLCWLLSWLQIFIWYVAAIAMLGQFPFLRRLTSWLLSTPVLLLGIWFLTSVGIRLGKALVNRFATISEKRALLSWGDSQRQAMRVATVAEAVKGLVIAIVVSAGVLAALGILGVPTGSILAGGAIVGLALSFGSQNLVRDLVNGFLILVEDQFAIGDVIDIDGASGLVEELNLRVTQLRSPDGALITIPNSSIVRVNNLTRSWSRVDFTIDVAYETDLDRAFELLDAIGQQMHSEPDWQDKIPELPEVLGVDSLSHEGMTIRVWIKTAPLQQWAVGREYRRRVRQALEREGIDIGKPHWAIDYLDPQRLFAKTASTQTN